MRTPDTVAVYTHPEGGIVVVFVDAPRREYEFILTANEAHFLWTGLGQCMQDEWFRNEVWGSDHSQADRDDPDDGEDPF